MSSQSPSLSNIFTNDLEEAWQRKNLGGTVIGSEKIFCLKYADDVAIVANTEDGMRDMIK